MLFKKKKKQITETKTKKNPKPSDLNDHTPNNLQGLVKHLLSIPKNMTILDISKKNSKYKIYSW